MQPLFKGSGLCKGKNTGQQVFLVPLEETACHRLFASHVMVLLNCLDIFQAFKTTNTIYTVLVPEFILANINK